MKSKKGAKVNEGPRQIGQGAGARGMTDLEVAAKIERMMECSEDWVCLNANPDIILVHKPSDVVVHITQRSVLVEYRQMCIGPLSEAHRIRSTGEEWLRVELAKVEAMELAWQDKCRHIVVDALEEAC